MNFTNSIRGCVAAVLLVLPAVQCMAQSAAELIAKGDVLDRSFHASEALKCYLPAEKLEPTNAALLVRIARQYRHLISEAGTDKEKLNLARVSLTFAQRAAALAPADSEAQLSPAISYGKMLPYLSSKEQIDTSQRIKTSADKALKLDPRNDTAWHVLGRWHQSLADVGAVKRALGSMIYGKLPVTTNEAALTCFEKAIAINPNRLRHHIELGRTYAKMGQTPAARRSIEKGMAMRSTEKDDPEMKQRGRDMLASLP